MKKAKRKELEKKNWLGLKQFGKDAKVAAPKGKQSLARQYYTKLMNRTSGILDPRVTGSKQTHKTQKSFLYAWTISKFGPLIKKGKAGYTKPELWKEAKGHLADTRKKTPISDWSSKCQKAKRDKSGVDEGVLPFFLFAMVDYLVLAL